MPSSPSTQSPFRAGIIGTGFIARGLRTALQQAADFEIGAVLTRRPLGSVEGFNKSDLVRDIDALIERSDVIVECSGDPIHSTEVISRALEAGLPVVTMNSEFHVTVGSYFVGRGLITEAQGDQAGSLAALHEECVGMGFIPVVYGNIKGFLNVNPSREDMTHWATKQGISIDQVTSFTDGSKVQVEQAHVANGLGASIVQTGLLAPKTATLREGAMQLAACAAQLGSPVADYVLTPESPGGVFIVATHDAAQASALRYMKLGDGPYYLLLRPYHLCHLEMPLTLRRVLNQHRPLLDNSYMPTISVATIAKHDLQPGDQIKRGMGSFDVRGECVKIADYTGHAPIGLMHNAVLRRKVPAGEIVRMEDLDLPDSLALKAWREIEARALGNAL
jgi:predicted homoserine dehydrogenase-like protein